MIVHRFSPKKGILVATPEDEDDLWCLRRIISEGDLISSETSRVIKDRSEFARPDKGERVGVNISLRVERVRIDSSLSRLRISGKIMEVSEEFLGRGSFHSLTVTPDKKISLEKDRWSDTQAKILENSWHREEGFIIIAIDRREAGVGRLKGTHLRMYPSIDSGFSGKMYQEKTKPDVSFYAKVEEMLSTVSRTDYKILITGPGITKNALAKYLASKQKTEHILIVNGVDIAGEDGVYMALRTNDLRKIVEESKLAAVALVLEEVIRRISRDDKRVAIGLSEVNAAGKMGAIESLMISDRVFEMGADESTLIEMINQVENLGGKTYLVDSSTDFGTQTSSLGGVVALLRYPTLRHVAAS